MESGKSKSSSTKKNWLIGCGIGCGAITVIVATLIIGGVLWVKNIVKGFQDSEAILEVLSERYGRIKEYCPNSDGTISLDRIEAFLKARDLTAPIRDGLEVAMNILTDGEWEGDINIEPKGGLKKVRTVFGLIRKIADFFKYRNQALLDVEMGMGEYYYLYTIVFYRWIEIPPIDGPPIQIGDNSEGFRISDLHDEESEELRRDHVLRRLHRMILPMLHNQYEKLTKERTEGASEEWRKTLEAEIAAMESDKYRLVWQDGLPDVITSNLKSYRSRLEASYSRFLNALEVTLEQR